MLQVSRRALIGATCALSCALLSLVAVSAVGQSSVATPRSSESTEKQETGLQVDFAGGSVATYFELIGSAASFESFVIEDAAALKGLTLPPVKLRGASLFTAVDVATESAFRDAGGQRVQVEANWVGPAAKNRQGRSIEGFAQLLKASACLVRVVAMAPENDQVPRFLFDLSSMKDSGAENLRTLVQTITAAIEVGGESRTFRTRYLEPTHMLVVRGTSEELVLAEQIIKAYLKDAVGERSADATPPTPQFTDAKYGGVPAPLTEAELATMSRAEAQAKLGQLSRARQNPGLDDATKTRLKDEFIRVLARAKSAS